MSPFGILAGLALVVGAAAASTLTVSPSGFYSGLTVRIEDGAVDPDGDCSDVLDNLEVGQTERWGWIRASNSPWQTVRVMASTCDVRLRPSYKCPNFEQMNK